MAVVLAIDLKKKKTTVRILFLLGKLNIEKSTI